MKHIFHLTFALLAGMALCACSSDDPMDNDQTAVPVQPGETGSDDTWSVKIEGDMTRGLSLSSSTLKPTFNGEKIYVYYDDAKVGELTAPSGSVEGDKTLTGSLNNASYTQGQSLTLCFLKDKGSATYTKQNGTIADIAANFDYATATATITNVDNNTHTLTISKATFTSQQAVVEFKFDKALSAGDVINITGSNINNASVTLTSAKGANASIYVALPVKNTTEANLTFTITHSSTSGYYKGYSTARAIANGNYYTGATVKLGQNMTISPTKGRIIAKDGYVYASESDAKSGLTSNASTGVIVYVGTGTGHGTYKHGLALSMTNPSSKVIWANRDNTATSPSAPSSTSGWFIPSLAQWNTILKSLKGGSGLTGTAKSDYANVNPGGGAANLSLNNYWSTTYGGDEATSSSQRRNYKADDGRYADQGTGSESKYANYVRRIYAF